MSKNLANWMEKNMIVLIMAFLTLYSFLPVFSPILFKLDAPKPAIAIQKVYRYLCHQRVDRSVFLFAENKIVAFYTVDELKELGVIPNEPIVKFGYRDDEYGYPFWGNEQVGYKVAYCIRDTALYTGLVVMGWAIIFYVKVLKKKLSKKLHWIVYALLMLPMVIDGIFQTIAEIAKFSFVPYQYIDSIEKRVITGVLFGAGFAVYIVRSLILEESAYGE